MVACLTDWLEEGLVSSQVESCTWEPEDEQDESETGSLDPTNLSEEEMTRARWATGETLSRSWVRLHQMGVVGETTTVGLPNPLPRDFEIEDHLFDCMKQLEQWLTTTQEIQTSTFTEFLSAHFQTKWVEGDKGAFPPPCIHPPNNFIKGKP